MTDLNLYRERDMGMKARRLMDDVAFAEAVKRLKEKMLAGWMESKSDEVEEREELFRMIKMMDSLTAELEFMIDDGTVAAEQIEQEEANG